MLIRLRFLGIGPGAAQWHLNRHLLANGTVRQIPDLERVQYRTISDVDDPISLLLGVGVPDDDRVDLNRTRRAVSRLLEYEGILPHLSYFQQYENTDPDSRYNSQAARQLHLWFQGSAVTGDVFIDMNDPNFVSNERPQRN